MKGSRRLDRGSAAGRSPRSGANSRPEGLCAILSYFGQGGRPGLPQAGALAGPADGRTGWGGGGGGRNAAAGGGGRNAGAGGGALIIGGGGAWTAGGGGWRMTGGGCIGCSRAA